jgi:hypothetical protein
MLSYMRHRMLCSIAMNVEMEKRNPRAKVKKLKESGKYQGDE